MTDKLKGDLLKQALAQYADGANKDGKVLQAATLKDRRLLCENLTSYFNSVNWVFNETTARGWVELKKKNSTSIDSRKKLASTRRYVAQIRAFNSWCVLRHYLTINFCQWINRPNEPETMKPHLNLSHDTLLQAIQLGVTTGKFDKARSKRIKKEGYDALMFMLFTSRRSGEMVALRGRDINIMDKLYRVRLKGGRILDFPIPENLVSMLAARVHKDRAFEVTAATTIKYLRVGLTKIGIDNNVTTEVINHTLRKAFARERKRNGDSVEEIASAMADKVDVVLKYYLDRDLDNMKKTVDNTAQSKNNIPVTDKIKEIRQFIERVVSNDSRFNPLAAETALNVDKLLKDCGA